LIHSKPKWVSKNLSIHRGIWCRWGWCLKSSQIYFMVFTHTSRIPDLFGYASTILTATILHIWNRWKL